MKVFLAALILVGVGVFVMCFNIIFLKKDFPQSDVGQNENMRKIGIRCMREEDEEIFSKKPKEDPERGICSGEFTPECKGCGLYEIERMSRKAK